MGAKFPHFMHQAKGIIGQKSFIFSGGQSSSSLVAATADVPKGYLAVYVGLEYKQRFVIPIAYLEKPLIQDLLSKAEEEFGYEYPMGCLTFPCSEGPFLDAISDYF
ncbi:hypothetical protein Droror1_Dr00001360 [Drosera rotundifolia]